MKKKIKKISSLGELLYLSTKDPAYEQLALSAAQNLGGNTNATLQEALQWLSTNAMETSEEGVVDEINFCR